MRQGVCGDYMTDVFKAAYYRDVSIPAAAYTRMRQPSFLKEIDDFEETMIAKAVSACVVL